MRQILESSLPQILIAKQMELVNDKEVYNTIVPSFNEEVRLRNLFQDREEQPETQTAQTEQLHAQEKENRQRAQKSILDLSCLEFRSQLDNSSKHYYKISDGITSKPDESLILTQKVILHSDVLQGPRNIADAIASKMTKSRKESSNEEMAERSGFGLPSGLGFLNDFEGHTHLEKAEDLPQNQNLHQETLKNSPEDELKENDELVVKNDDAEANQNFSRKSAAMLKSQLVEEFNSIEESRKSENSHKIEHVKAAPCANAEIRQKELDYIESAFENFHSLPCIAELPNCSVVHSKSGKRVKTG